ncbi:MAG: SpvB/TcaC N-terminal domain-containing protein [Bacteroidales bacterium]|jgi:RHS repeat-associated protein|nr:SpvB/TcaC N-terminal domain-containing protein [Bacteroidales bacterium]
MSRTIILLLSSLLWLSTIAQQQGENIELNSAIIGGQHEYIATNSIRLTPGFRYKPLQSSDYFVGRIDDYAVIPPGDGITGGDPANNYGGLPGTLPGDLMVSGSGGAVYNISIAVPEGLAGMTPQLALVYNSQGGNGLLGMGWNLSGLSSISRTGKTIYHDGKKEGIKFNTTDNFVLDGQRLMQVNVGETEYRTEVESFMRIIPQQIVGGEPGWFKVQTKNGQTLYYGKESHSRIEAIGKATVMTWMLDKIEDQMGNTIQFTYLEEGGMGIIQKIQYGANQVTGQSHIYELAFEYNQNRPDKYRQYIGGSYVETKYLLKKIFINRLNQQTLHHYKLDYDLDFYPRMQHVWLYEGDTETEFFNPTTMEWGKFDKNGFVSIEHDDGFEFGILTDNFFLDINGDGLTDKVAVKYTWYQNGNLFGKEPVSWNFRLRQRNNRFANPISLGSPPPKFFSHLITSDFNGDGQGDFAYVRFNHENQDITIIDRIALSNGNGFTIHILPNGGIQSKDYPVFNAGDFDGDGISELLLAKRKNIYNIDNVFIYRYYEENNTLLEVFNEKIDFGNTDYGRANLIIADFDGDGRSDLLRTAEYGGNPHTSNCFIYRLNMLTGEKEFIYGDGYPTTFHQIYPGDFNGDGITDILTYNYTADNPVWEIGLFTGSGFVQMENIPNIGHFNLYEYSDAAINKLLLFDFNTDNKTDILIMSKENFNDNAANYTLHYSNGNNFNDTMTGSFPLTGGFVSFVNGYQFRMEKVTLVMDFNGDAYADFYLERGVYNNFVFLHDPSNTFNRVLGFTNGMGVQTRPKYLPLTNPSIYTKYTTATYPLIDFQPAMYVVHAVEREMINKGLTTTETYTYAGAKVHLLGKGFMGFAKREKNDRIQYIKTEEVNSIYISGTKFYYPYNSAIKTYKSAGSQLSATHNTLNLKTNSINEMVFFPYVERIDAWNNEYKSLQHQLSTRKLMEYDDYGNLSLYTALSDSVFMPQGAPSQAFNHEKITETHYSIDTDNWIFLPEIIDTKVRYHSKPYIRHKTSNTFYPAASPYYPLLEIQNDYPNGDILDELTTRTHYQYDIFGNPKKLTLSAPNDPSAPENRVVETEYGSHYKHRFLTKKENALGYITAYTYDDNYGWILSDTTPNGLVTNYTHHPMGIESKVLLPDETQQGTALRWAAKHDFAPDNATYYSWVKSSGQAAELVFYHKTGAELRIVTTGFDGRPVYQDKSYDNENRLFIETLPYFKDENEKPFTLFRYDGAGRLELLTAPDGTVSKKSYQQYAVTTTNAQNQSTTQSYNAAGWLSKSTDALGTEVNYSYFSDGKLHQTMISAQPNTLITLSYNSRRQRSTLSDPNYGLMQTTYNAFGELIHQTTPRGFETTYTYDLLGRTTSRIENEGTTTWHYSTTPGFLGTLESIEGLGQITSYTYDALLRPKTVVENINSQDYTTTYTYDHFGRPETITHPSGFAEQNTYNNHGYLKKISNANDQSLLWEAQVYYAPGMLRQSATGNGLVTRSLYEPETLRLTGSFVFNAAQERVQDFEYKYDKLGNMQHRIKWLNRDKNQFLKEEFWYDDLNRLTDIKLNGQPTGGHDYDPEGLGNITAKTANGQQLYSNAEYGAGNHGPHAISSATTTANVFPADPQTAEYTSFEQLNELRQGDKTLFINYGHHHQRISQRYFNQYQVTLKQWAGACEYITRNGQTTTLTYLSGPGGLYALHLINPDESESIRYIHTDHLGSWTAISDDTGTIINEQSYDAWGNRRSPATWTSGGMAVQAPLFDRGFTGHEHLDGFQLINMNGRMYDPVVSRMLAPDNFVQTPDFSQNFNRYSYALNNPLKYTDPDGEFIIEAIMIGAFINTTMQLASGKVNSVGDFFLAAGIGAASGAAGAGVGIGIQTASAGASFWAGFLGSSQGISTILDVGYKSSFLSGLVSGGVGGFTGGFTGGFGNDIAQGQSFGAALGNGAKTGVIAGLSSALIGGVAEGLDAVYGNSNHQRNFWTGKDIAMGRRPFSLINGDRAFEVYQTPIGFEPRSYYEGIMDGSKNKAYHDRVRYGNGSPDQISNGAISRVKNYLMPGDNSRDYRIEKFIGRADMMVLDEAGHEVIIRVNGKIVTPTGGHIPLYEGSENLSIQIINNKNISGVLSPYKFTVKGFINLYK